MVVKEFGKPDLVHLNIVYPLGIWALWLKFRFGIPYVVTENSSGFHMNSTHKYPRKVLRLCKWILRKSNYLLPVSDNLKENLKLLAPKNKYCLISNVVDENLFQPTKKNNTNEVRRLIHISTGVDEIKNLSGMIRVMKNLQTENFPVSLDIVSDGNIEYAKDLSKELDLDLSVFFHSTKTTNEIAEMISQSDALLMFSNYENFPCVIAESMMSGKPVIATNVNGIPEHVLKDNGILVEPRNEDQLGNAIKKFLNSELKFDGRKIRQYALEHFSYTSVSNQFQEIYNEILIKK